MRQLSAAASREAISGLYGRVNAGIMVAVVLCCILQWSAGRTIATQKIFDSRHTELGQNFNLFTTALESEVTRECASGTIRRIYFDDLDVGLVYIVNALKDPSCKPVREMPITPLDPAQLAQCSATIIKEKNLNWWTPGLLRAELGPVAPLVSSTRKWSSPDGNFGFEVYRKKGCTKLAAGQSR
jgi:hypothetical protein